MGSPQISYEEAFRIFCTYIMLLKDMVTWSRPLGRAVGEVCLQPTFMKGLKEIDTTRIELTRFPTFTNGLICQSQSTPETLPTVPEITRSSMESLHSKRCGKVNHLCIVHDKVVEKVASLREQLKA